MKKKVTTDKKSESFSSSYNRLVEISKKMESLNESDIDNLEELIEEASKVYSMCKDRLQSVKNLVEEQLEDLEELE